MKRQIDVAALYAAVDSKRQGLALSWRDLAGELGISSSVFTRLAQGGRPDLDTFVALAGWLGVAADDFIEGDQPTEEQAEETVAVISGYLRADKALKPENARAIEEIVRATYDQLADKPRP